METADAPERCAIVHALPGRVRLRVPWIKADRRAAQEMVSSLARLAGITQAEANADCASVTLSFDSECWTPIELCEQVDESAPRTARSPVAPTHAMDHSSWYELSLSSLGMAAALVLDSLSPLVLPFLLAGSAVPMATRAYEAFAREGRLTVDVLDTSAALLLSLQGRFNTAMFMVWLVNLGDYIRDATVSEARSAVQSVLAYRTASAWVVKGRRKIKTAVEQLAVGDTVVVYPGDRIPVDGRVLSGTAVVDQRLLTGESVPAEKTDGAPVYASTTVQAGKLYIRTLRVGNETEAAKIVRLVEQAPAHETTIQNYAERWANDLVPYSLAGAGLVGLSAGVNAAASVLTIDYGTGIRVAAPTAVLASMTAAARRGILFKGGRSLEQLAAVDALVFDKTGTPSTGAPTVQMVRSYGGAGRERVLALAAAAEQRLNHPVAQAIVRAARDAGLAIPPRRSSDYKVGLGLASDVAGRLVQVGGLRYMEHLGIVLPHQTRQDLANCETQAVSPICVACDGRVIGLLGYRDALRPESAEVVQRLRALGMRDIVMLTGDHRAVARHAAETVGIDRWLADLLPEQKVAEVQALQRRGLRVAVVGDGINDSPALAHADVGIAVKGGADVAQDTAQVVLLHDDLRKIPAAIELARETVALIKENWSLISVPNTIALALACGGLLGPGAATLLSNGSAIVATGNALRPLWDRRARRSEESRQHPVDHGLRHGARDHLAEAA